MKPSLPEQTPTTDWFKAWFNSPYYHLLYKNRDNAEAQAFLDRLLDYLQPIAPSVMLDLACGKGRHAKYLSEKGHMVIGLDIAPDSIAYAQQFTHEFLHFHVHDMRLPFKNANFDYIFNFFTSFGYFEDIADNHQTIKAMAATLEEEGKVVIDYLNATKVVRDLVPKEQKVINEVQFDIQRWVKNGIIYKQINILDHKIPNFQPLQFTEQVQALQLQDFQQLFQQNGFEIQQLWGNYHLQPFNETNSDRLVILAEKKK